MKEKKTPEVSRAEVVGLLAIAFWGSCGPSPKAGSPPERGYGHRDASTSGTLIDASPNLDAPPNDSAPASTDPTCRDEVKEGCACTQANAQQACWPGPPGQANVGMCQPGTQTCVARGSGEFQTLAWGPCTGYVWPPDGCSPMVDARPSVDGPPMPRPRICDPNDDDDDSTFLNTEAGILIAYQPAEGQSVAANGQIKVWAADEFPIDIAPGEQVDPNTGKILVPGDRTVKVLVNTDPDVRTIYEPALYIAPDTPENGGTPHFPTAIRGGVNNAPPGYPRTPILIAGMDPLPPVTVNRSEAEINGCISDGTHEDDVKYCTAEFIWDVSSLNLSPGTYLAIFVVHDGDVDRGAGCIQIVITPSGP